MFGPCLQDDWLKARAIADGAPQEYDEALRCLVGACMILSVDIDRVRDDLAPADRLLVRDALLEAWPAIITEALSEMGLDRDRVVAILGGELRPAIAAMWEPEPAEVLLEAGDVADEAWTRPLAEL